MALLSSIANAEALNALRSKNFRWLLAGSLLSSVARWGGIFVFGWLTLELTGSASKTGLVLALRSAGYFLSPIAGIVADRYDRRMIMIGTALLSVGYALALSLLLLTDGLQFWHLLVISAVSSLTQAFDNPIRKTIAADVVEPKYLTSSYALTTVATDTTAVIGPTMFGALIGVLGITGIAWIMVSVYTFNVFALFMMRVRTTDGKVSKASPIKNLVEGVKYVWGYQAILSLIVMAIIMNAMGAAQTVIMPVFAKQIFDVGAGGLGMLLSAGAFGGLAGASIVVMTGNHAHRAKMTLISVTVMGMSLALFSISPSFYIALCVAALTGLNSALFLTLGNALLLQHSASNMRGRVMGVRGLCLGIGLLMSPTVGFMIDALSARAAGVIIGLSGAGLMLIVAVVMPGLFKLDSMKSRAKMVHGKLVEEKPESAKAEQVKA